MDGLKVTDDKAKLSAGNLSRENTPTLTISPSPSIGLIQVHEATADLDGKALLSTQYGWEEIEEDRSSEHIEEKESRKRRAFNANQNQSLNQFQTLSAITKQKEKMGDVNFKQRLLSNTALKKLEVEDSTPKKRFQNAIRRVVHEIRFTKLFGHVKKTELERIARNANHALLLNRKEQEQKVSIEMILKMEIKETALSVLEKTESAYKKIFWNRICPSEGFKEFVREVTEKKNQYRDELNTQAVENKENLMGRRRNVTTFGHDDEDETDSYFSNESDLEDALQDQGTFSRLRTTFLPGLRK